MIKNSPAQALETRTVLVLDNLTSRSSTLLGEYTGWPHERSHALGMSESNLVVNEITDVPSNIPSPMVLALWNRTINLTGMGIPGNKAAAARCIYGFSEIGERIEGELPEQEEDEAGEALAEYLRDEADRMDAAEEESGMEFAQEPLPLGCGIVRGDH
jgi:hypothetical protein